jgi:predicted RNA binding protein YcfA (HicA-like mRNA interferase family)
MCRLIEAKGWVLQRIQGSHRIYSKVGERKIISIPVHGNRDLKPLLASRIARDANIEMSSLGSAFNVGRSAERDRQCALIRSESVEGLSRSTGRLLRHWADLGGPLRFNRLTRSLDWASARHMISGRRRTLAAIVRIAPGVLFVP